LLFAVAAITLLVNKDYH